VSSRFRVDLLRREAAAVADISAAYDVAANAIQQRLDALIARMEEATAAGEVITEGWLRQEARYAALLTQIEQQLQSFAETAASPLTDAQRGFVETATDQAKAVTRAAIGPTEAGVSLTWNALPAAALESLVGFAADGSPLQSVLEALGPDGAAAMRDALIAGVAAGDGPRKIAAAAAAQGNVSRARAVNIARTETMRAARTATIDSYRANSDVVKGWTWLAALDMRTCAACWAMHGTHHALGEPLDGHCQCRCVPVPDTVSWAELTGDSSIPDTRPLIRSGADVFAGLSEEDQQQVLGPGLHGLYAAGAPLSAMVTQTSDVRWGTMRQQATAQEATANARG